MRSEYTLYPQRHKAAVTRLHLPWAKLNYTTVQSSVWRSQRRTRAAFSKERRRRFLVEHGSLLVKIASKKKTGRVANLSLDQNIYRQAVASDNKSVYQSFPYRFDTGTETEAKG